MRHWFQYMVTRNPTILLALRTHLPQRLLLLELTKQDNYWTVLSYSVNLHGTPNTISTCLSQL